jgi:hypothetical protein
MQSNNAILVRHRGKSAASRESVLVEAGWVITTVTYHAVLSRRVATPPSWSGCVIFDLVEPEEEEDVRSIGRARQLFPSAKIIALVGADVDVANIREGVDAMIVYSDSEPPLFTEQLRRFR